MVFRNSIIPYPVRSYLFFRSKKCRIYAAFGVSQTPKFFNKERSFKMQNNNFKRILAIFLLTLILISNTTNHLGINIPYVSICSDDDGVSEINPFPRH